MEGRQRSGCVMGIFGSKPMASMPPPDYWALKKLNEDVNRRVRGQKFDDCEWYTTFKSIDLDKAGFGKGERYYVSTDGNERAPDHVILKVGDYFLDNRFPNPMTERQMLRSGYRHFPGYDPSVRK